MPVTGYWGPKQFVVSDQKIIPVDGLKISQAVKVETQNAADGNSVSNIKGKDAMEVSMKVAYYVQAGANPISEMNGWLNLLGQSHPLYIGSQQIGSKNLTLQKVQVEDEIHNNKGEFFGLVVAIALKELSSTSTPTASNSTKSSGSKKSPSGSGDKTSALRASPSQDEKKEKNPRGGSGGRGSGVGSDSRMVMKN